MHRGLPSTTLTVILSLDGPVVAAEDPRRPGGSGTPRADLVLAGLHTGPVLVEQPSHQEGIQLQIDPLACPCLFGVRAAELVGSFDGLEVLGRAGQQLWEQVGSVTDPAARIARIDRAFRAWSLADPARTETVGTGAAPARAVRARTVRAEVAEAWRLVLASGGRIGMDALAAAVALSPRQLRAEFSRELGIGPKSAARLARFEIALGRIADSVHAGGVPGLSSIAVETGFADHAHLTRDFTRFTGISPSAWLREERRNLQAGGHGTAQD